MKQILTFGNQTFELGLERSPGGTLTVTVGDQEVQLELGPQGNGIVRVQTDEGHALAHVSRQGKKIFVTLEGRDYRFEVEAPEIRRSRKHDHAGGEITLPMPGTVIQIHVKEGESVEKGQPLLVVEAMKMEHTLKAPKAGTVTQLLVKEGQMVDAGLSLLEVT